VICTYVFSACKKFLSKKKGVVFLLKNFCVANVTPLFAFFCFEFLVAKIQKLNKVFGGSVNMKSKNRTRIDMRVTQDEYALLKSKAEDANQNMSEYIRRKALYGYTVRRGNIEIQRLVWEINKIGVNINQVVHLANQAQFISTAQIEQLTEMHNEVWDLLDKFVEPLTVEWGLHNNHRVKIVAAD